MRIPARYQAMAEDELLAMIPASEYKRIKEQDPNPLFKAYVIGHEGTSSGILIGAGTVVSRWFRSAIEALYRKIQAGIKLFHDHGDTNEHDGRIPIGEVVGKALRTIKEKLSTIIVAYIKPDFRGIPLDVASIEADIVFKKDEKIGTYTSDVERVTGIALGNSAINRPGFPGATLLAQVQAFAKKTNHAQHREGDRMEPLTVEEIREFLKTAKDVEPSDIFTTEALTKDPVFAGQVDLERRAAVRGVLKDHRKRDDEEWSEAKKKLEKELIEVKESLAKKDSEIALGKIPTLFKKEAETRKLTDQQKKFIEPRLDRFKPTAADKTETEFKVHLDKELDEFKTTAELFGIKIEAPAVKAEGDGKDKTGAAAPGSGTGAIEDKYLDPEQNPMIPKV